ncbi:MAG: thioesterase [Acidobacteria bacterium]|nr:MAG: thioesterase [Acidobacteriota bacterium]
MSNQLNPKWIGSMQKNFTTTWKFRLILCRILPMGFLSGMKVRQLDEERCVVTVPYRWINKNPFRSTFWAVLGMAAEMSSGALLAMYTFRQKPSIAMLIVGTTAKFIKKAQGVTTFTCTDGLKVRKAIEKTLETGEPECIECLVTGKDKHGNDVAEFTFTWSVKARSGKG